MASQTNETPTPLDTTPPTIVYRAITLRVDLRVLAAIGGALIVIGALLPWVAPTFDPLVRALRVSTTGGWPLIAIGLAAIVILFLPRFRAPRVSVGAATLGLVAGVLALNSALNTLALRDIVIGTQPISPLAGIGLGVYLTLAGSIIAILAGLAPQPSYGEVARTEVRLWQPSAAIFGSLLVLFVLGAMGLGWWIGNSAGGGRATPTPQSFDTGILATPLINAQVNPLIAGSPEPTVTEAIPTVPSPTAQIAPRVPLTETPTPTLEPLRPTFTPPPQPTATTTSTPTPSPTQPQSPQATPTVTPTPTITTTITITTTSTTTPTATPTVTPTQAN